MLDSKENARLLVKALEEAKTSGTLIGISHLEYTQLMAGSVYCDAACVASLQTNKEAFLVWPERGSSSYYHGILTRPEGQGEASPFARDFDVIGSQDGKIQIKTLRDPDHWKAFDVIDTSKPLTSFCGVPTELEYVKRPGIHGNTDRGGNVFSLPNGTCLVGSKMHEPYAKEVCGENVKIKEIEATTGLAHIDISVNFIPDPKTTPPCNFKVTMSSTEEMKRYLAANPTVKFFEKEEYAHAIGGADVSNAYYGTCAFVQQYMYLKEVQDTLVGPDDSHGPSSRSVSQLIWELFKPKNALAIGVIRDYDPAVEAEKKAKKEKQARLEAEQAQADREKYAEIYKIKENPKYQKPYPCTEVTNQQYLDILNTDPNLAALKKWLADQAKDGAIPDKSILNSLNNHLKVLERVQQENNEVELKHEEIWQQIKAELPAQCRGDDMRVKIPVLRNGGKDVSPGATNTQTVGNMIIFPMQLNSHLNDFVAQKFKNLGLKAESQNTLYYHQRLGNVHCTTNEMRLCRPD